MRTESITMRCPAKLNLSLRIRGRRTSGPHAGYHELVSLMTKINLHDTLELRRLDRPEFTITCPGHPELETPDNLVLKAARQLVPAGQGVAVTLRKEIPHGAGLGGGSSDAASTLMAVSQLFGLDVDATRLHEIAAGLGADVPFFLLPEGAAMATGIGTQLRPLHRLPQLTFLLLHPGFGVSTPWAYQAFAALQSDKNGQNILTLSSRNDKKISRSWVLRTLRNDLETAVVASHPRIGELKRRLLDFGAIASLMSGSGSSLFGVFEDGSAAQRAQQLLGEEQGNTRLWCRMVQNLTP